MKRCLLRFSPGVEPSFHRGKAGPESLRQLPLASEQCPQVQIESERLVTDLVRLHEHTKELVRVDV